MVHIREKIATTMAMAILLFSTLTNAANSYTALGCDVKPGKKLPHGYEVSNDCQFYEGYSDDALVPVLHKPSHQFGFANRDGKIVIPPQYQYATGFHSGLAAVSKKEYYGYINNKNQVVIPFSYSFADYFHNGLAGVRKEGKSGFINPKGELVIHNEYDCIVPFNQHDLATVGKMIDTQGDSNCIGDNIAWGMIDKQGKIITPLQYNFSDDCTVEGCDGYINGYVKIGVIASKEKERTKYLFGLLDSHGKEVIPPIYDAISAVSEGLVAAEKDHKWGVIDSNNQIVIPFTYDNFLFNDNAFCFLGTCPMVRDGIIFFMKNKHWGAVDMHNKVTVPFIYEDVFHFSFEKSKNDKIREKQWLIVKKNQKYGVIDRHNKIIVPFIYNNPEDIKISNWK